MKISVGTSSKSTALQTAVLKREYTRIPTNTMKSHGIIGNIEELLGQGVPRNFRYKLKRKSAKINNLTSTHALSGKSHWVETDINQFQCAVWIKNYHLRDDGTPRRVIIYIISLSSAAPAIMHLNVQNLNKVARLILNAEFKRDL